MDEDTYSILGFYPSNITDNKWELYSEVILNIHNPSNNLSYNKDDILHLLQSREVND